MIEKRLKNGFTLVEMIIAISLFGIVVSISVGSLLGLFDANRKSQSLASVLNNLNYSIENMTRIIRFAKSYHCDINQALPVTSPRNCGGGANPAADSIAVTNGAVTTIFRLNGSKIQISTNGGTTYSDMTSSEVTITNLKFYVYGSTPGDASQPYVLITIGGYAGSKPSSRSNFDIQTIVSQRPLDI